MRKAEIFKAAAGLEDEIYDKPHKEICSKYANAGQKVPTFPHCADPLHERRIIQPVAGHYEDRRDEKDVCKHIPVPCDPDAELKGFRSAGAENGIGKIRGKVEKSGQKRQRQCHKYHPSNCLSLRYIQAPGGSPQLCRGSLPGW